ncbi:MAG: TonB-dependent receptor [Burkholderiales bacterium]|nr:TonB-dependent receptor [Burkholderiales bacterium]
MHSRIAAAACAALSWHCAWAQSAASMPTLPEVSVSAAKEPDFPLTQPGIEAARRNAAQAVGGTAVIDADDYLKGSAVTPADAFAFAPGAFAQSRIPGAEESRLSIRGSGLQRTFHGRGLRVLQDGVPVNLADGSFDFQALEPMAARYIEVYRGANALAFGAASLGGAVNYVSPTGYDAAPLLLRGEAGSFGHLRGQAAAAGVDGDVDYYVSLTHFSQDGYRRQSKQANQRLSANAGYRIGTGLETRFYLLHALTDSELPGNLTKAQLNNTPRMANAGNVAGNHHRDFTLTRISNKTVWASDGHRFEAGAFYSHKSLWHPIFQVLDIDSDDYGLSLQYGGEGRVAGRRNVVVAGLSAARGVAGDDRYVNVAGRQGARTAGSRQTALGLDLFVENRHYLTKRLALVAGAQVSRATRKYEDRFLADGDNGFDADYSQVSPKLGLLYEPQPSLQLFANVSRGFEPPSFGELAGGPGITQVRKQSAWTAEFGTRGALRDLRWDAAYYRAEVRDELLALNDAAGAPLGTVNAPETLHQGIELGLDGKLIQSWRLRAAYLWNDFRFRSHPVYGNNELPGLPKQFLKLEVLYMTPGGFHAGPNLEWSPQDHAVDMANTLHADRYAVWGFRIGQRMARGMSWFVDARNLADRRYAATTGVIADSRSPGAGGQNAAQFNPGLGRSVFAGVEWKP